MFGEELPCTRPVALPPASIQGAWWMVSAGSGQPEEPRLCLLVPCQRPKKNECGSRTCSHSEGSSIWRVWGIGKGQSHDCTWPHDAVPHKEQPWDGRHWHLKVNNALSDLLQLMESLSFFAFRSSSAKCIRLTSLSLRIKRSLEPREPGPATTGSRGPASASMLRLGRGLPQTTGGLFHQLRIASCSACPVGADKLRPVSILLQP